LVHPHENDVGTAFGGKHLKRGNHGRSYALPPMTFMDSKVIDVQLLASMLELGQDVGSSSANDFATKDGNYGNEGTAGEQTLHVAIISLQRGVREEPGSIATASKQPASGSSESQPSRLLFGRASSIRGAYGRAH
jgi:hypothetical protein